MSDRRSVPKKGAGEVRVLRANLFLILDIEKTNARKTPVLLPKQGRAEQKLFACIAEYHS